MRPRGAGGLVGAPHEAAKVAAEGSPVAAHPVASGIPGGLHGGGEHGGEGEENGEGGEGGHCLVSLAFCPLWTP